MEVIKPSDKLEKQLLDDAKKKAGRILKNAEKEGSQILKEEIGRAEKEIEELDKNGQFEIGKITTEIKAVLPLDIMRKRLNFINAVMNYQIDDFFNEIEDKNFIDIIKLSILKVKDIFKGMDVKLKYKQIDQKIITEAILKSIPDITIKETSSNSPEKGFVIESTDKKITYKSTIVEFKSYLLENYRGELSKELFAKGI